MCIANINCKALSAPDDRLLSATSCKVLLCRALKPFLQTKDTHFLAIPYQNIILSKASYATYHIRQYHYYFI